MRIEGDNVNSIALGPTNGKHPPNELLLLSLALFPAGGVTGALSNGLDKSRAFFGTWSLRWTERD